MRLTLGWDKAYKAPIGWGQQSYFDPSWNISSLCLHTEKGGA